MTESRKLTTKERLGVAMLKRALERSTELCAGDAVDKQHALWILTATCVHVATHELLGTNVSLVLVAAIERSNSIPPEASHAERLEHFVSAIERAITLYPLADTSRPH